MSDFFTHEFQPTPSTDYFLCSMGSVSAVDADSICFIDELNQYLLGFSNHKRKVIENALKTIKRPMMQVAVGYTDSYQYGGVICDINDTYSIFRIS
jgi:hypothetical protein